MLPILINAVAMMFFVAGFAFAAGGEVGGSALMTQLFFSFLAVIVIGQVIPGLVLFGSMLRGLLGRTARETSR